MQKSFQNDEEWHLFYCDSTLGCPVIHDCFMQIRGLVMPQGGHKMLLNYKGLKTFSAWN